MSERLPAAPACEDLLREAEARLRRRELAGVVDLLHAAERGGADDDLCAGQRWMAHMLGGDFEAGWRENDALRRRGAPDPHRFWLGEDISGARLMLRCLHGFGDAVQMLRYVPRLREKVSELIVEVPPRLLETAPCLAGMSGAKVITWGDRAPVCAPAWDVQAEVMELPYMFRTTCDQLPLATRYLVPPVAEVDRVRRVMGEPKGTRVGVVWSAGEWNPSRSIPICELRSLAEFGHCELWSLQGGRSASQWVEFGACVRQGSVGEPARLRDAAECGEGILTLAAVISQLDVVITVDTLAAHLAGAMGVPAWVMLRYEADWRWMTGCDNSPWYPSLRLFRQPEPGDWKTVVGAVKAELKQIAERA